MAQEFTINSSAIESKINQLLPSQGGFGAGVDFSASTMVIPIVDLTETAEGSDVRVDLQTALSLNSVTSYLVNNTTTTIVATTGYYRVFGTVTNFAATACRFELTDGITTKRIREFSFDSGTNAIALGYDFNVFLQAGVSLVGVSGAAAATLTGTTRQIADISGNLVNP
jgi:hypothetical protein